MITIKPSNSRSLASNIALLAFATFWNIFLAVFISSLNPFQGFHSFKIIFLLFSIPFILVGIFLIIITVLAFVQDAERAGFSKEAKITIDTDKPTPGQEIKITYFQTFKRDLTLEVFNVEFTAERLLKKEGSIYSKEQKVFYKKEESNIQCFSGQEMIKQYNFKIPTEEEISSFSTEKDIKWELVVRYKASTSPTRFSDTFTIEIV